MGCEFSNQYSYFYLVFLIGSCLFYELFAVILLLNGTVIRQIQSQLVKADADLKPMLKGVPQNTSECHTSLMRIVSDYCRLLRQVRRVVTCSNIKRALYFVARGVGIKGECLV